MAKPMVGRGDRKGAGLHVSPGEESRRYRGAQPERRRMEPRLLTVMKVYQSEKLVLYQIFSVPFLALLAQSLVFGSASMRARSSSQRCLT